MPTSKDVAEIAGVSHTTVSRAFRNDPSVRPDTYQKVMAAAEQLGYSPNFIAASLRMQRTKTVGFINSHGFNPLFLEIAKILEEQLQDNGYRLLLSFDEGDPDRQLNAIRTMASARVDSIVFTPAFSQADREERLRQLRAIVDQTKIHFISLACFDLEDVSNFIFDDNYGAYVGMKHLLDNGHPRTLVVGGNNRLEGFRKAYAELGQEPPIPQLSVDHLPRDEMARLIREALLRYKPTAVFAISDPVTTACYEALTAMKRQIPGEISFLAFDDAYWLQVLGIDAIGHPSQAVATAIARQILDYCEAGRTEEPGLPMSTVFRPYLIKRSSVKPIVS